MVKTYRRLSDHEQVDLIDYLKKKIQPDTKIYIGADSQNIKTETIYAEVIILHHGNSGGHVLYTKYSVKRIKSSFERLWNEVDSSINLAIFLEENGIQKIDYIDLDLNPDPKYKSNEVLRAALGYVESMGFKARVKPNATAASCCADYLLHRETFFTL